jgi:hypothetical protein
VCNVHAKNGARHVTDDTNEVAGLIVEDSHLISARTSCEDQVLLSIEHCSIEHRWRFRLKLLHKLRVGFLRLNLGGCRNAHLVFLINEASAPIDAIPLIGADTLKSSQIEEL